MHVIELALSMIFDSKLLHKYWVESFFTANFLINLMPSSSLDKTYNSPYQKLHGTTPDYTALRALGCACYPTLRD